MRRSIIRGFFIGVLLLCVGVWLWSYISPEETLCHHFAGSFRLHHLTIAQGKFVIGEITGERVMLWDEGWTFQPLYKRDFAKHILDEPNSLDQPNFHLLGFAYGRSTVNLHRWIAVVPLWFPATISAALLWWAWRKTRLPVKGRAFPVEVGEKL